MTRPRPRSWWRLAPAMAVVAAVLVPLAWHPGAGDAATTVPSEGRQLWLSDCATCHGPRGAGTSRGIDITRSGTASVDFMVRTGRMPLAHPNDRLRRHPVRYTEAQIRSLVAYTGSFVSGPAAATPDLSGANLGTGQRRYLESCAACHQSAGSGGALAYGDAAPPLGQATSREVAEAVRTGPGNMPTFGPDTLSDRELVDVTAYVEHLRKHPEDRGGFPLGHVGPVPEGLVAWLFGLGTIVAVTRWLGSVRAEDVDPDEQT